MKKHGFTLVEIVIVIVLIGLVLTMVAKLGSGFSDKLRFASTKESAVQALEHIIQEAATTSDVRVGATGHSAYGYIAVGIASSGSTVERTYHSWDLQTPITRSVAIENATFMTSGFSLKLMPYALGCTALSGTDFRIYRTPRPTAYVACYEVNSATCKLREKACN